MLDYWLVYRFLRAGRRWLTLPAFVSLLGMAIGVASLFVAMAVISGFEKTLKTTVTDVFGHVLVLRQNEKYKTAEELFTRVKAAVPEVESYTPFVELEAVIASGGKISGVMVQAIEPNSVDNVLRLKDRLREGRFEFAPGPDGLPGALLGKGLIRKYGLKVDDEVALVMPMPDRADSTRFSPRLQRFRVRGVLDLGKFEYDERYVVTEISVAQRWAGLEQGFSGLRLRLHDEDRAAQASARISTELGAGVWATSWSDVNRNLMEAVRLERVVIFSVLLVIVIAASFNISSHMFVAVLQRYSDISILRAMGFRQRRILHLFSLQGLFFGIAGAFCGILLGLLLCVAFVVAQKYWVLLPAEVYRFDHVGVYLRPTDLVMIVVAALAVCLAATLAPAWRASRLSPVEGLRYE